MTSNTYTLTTDNSGAIVFDLQSRGDRETLFMADSPNSDLAGRLSFRISNETTKAGIQRTLVQFKKPYQTDGEYKDHAQVNVTITRPVECALVEVDELLELVQECFALDTGGFRMKMAEAQQ